MVYFGLTIGFIYGLCLNKRNMFLLTKTMHIPIIFINNHDVCLLLPGYVSHSQKILMQPVFEDLKQMLTWFHEFISVVRIRGPPQHTIPECLPVILQTTWIAITSFSDHPNKLYLPILNGNSDGLTTKIIKLFSNSHVIHSPVIYVFFAELFLKKMTSELNLQKQ